MAEGDDLKPDPASSELPPEAEQWRHRIDEIDEQILRLLNSRSACAVEIGRIKRERDIPIYSPSRERWILARLEELNPGPLVTRITYFAPVCLIFFFVMEIPLLREKPDL